MERRRKAEVHLENLLGALQGEAVSIGRRRWVPTRFVVHYKDGRREAWVEIRVGRDTTPRVVQVRTALLDPDEMMSVEDLRLPLRSIITRAWGEAVQHGQEEAPGTLLSQVKTWREPFSPTFGVDRVGREAQAEMRRRGYTVLTDDHLRRVASVYRAAMKRGRPPIVAIMEEFTVPRPTAKRWTQEARSRGFLGPTRPRLAGERPQRGGRKEKRR